jgi:hypothetical protein
MLPADRWFITPDLNITQASARAEQAYKLLGATWKAYGPVTKFLGNRKLDSVCAWLT